MLLRDLFFKEQNDRVAEKIKKDLRALFNQKGINVTKLIIETKYNKLNVEVCIKGD